MEGNGDGTPLHRMMLPDSSGTIWCDDGLDRYVACAAAARLLCMAPEGSLAEAPVSDLRSVFGLGTSAERRHVNFRSPSGSICRAGHFRAPDGRSVIVLDELRSITDRVFDLKASEREYRELFENATYGVYRAAFDGRILRANPFMVKLHGYETEDALVAAMSKGDCYVDRARRAAFYEELLDTGKVNDFVAEAVRHATGERIWVSEAAWLVKDAAGSPRHYAGTIVEITERIASQERLRFAAETDALTGLANRTAFGTSLERAIAAAGTTPVTVFLVDLDRFKDVNDIYGHDRGDDVLRICARRLQKLLPHGGTLARLGGDEFALMVKGIAADDVARLGAEIVAAFASPVEVEGTGHRLGASVGIARAPDHADTAQELMRNADLALYSVKDQGRNHARVFDAELDRQKQERHQLELDLRGAQGRGEFALHYQPVVDSRTSHIVGLEALLRWNHPVRGRVPPSSFVPVAEEAGLMLDIGSWVIDEACRHILLPDHILVSVNVSALQFRSFDLPKVIAAAVARNGIDASRLELEITESVILKNEAATFAVLKELRGLGVRIALDDFGTAIRASAIFSASPSTR